MSEPSHQLPQSVFVYGTLMPGERYQRVAHAAAAPLAQEPAQLARHTLYDLRPEGYPALVPGDQSHLVHGWVLHYGDGWNAALPALDELEGLHLSPPLYRRTQVQVQTTQGPQTVWVYLYARLQRLSEPGAAVIVSGRWTDAPDRHAETPWPSGVAQGPGAE